jgi:hypothetical protein
LLVVLVGSIVAALGLVPASVGATRSTTKRPKPRPPVSHCGRVPVGWTVVASDARAVIIKRDLKRTVRNEKIGWSWRYCLRPLGLYYTLLEDSSDDYDSTTFTDPVLSGRYAATTEQDTQEASCMLGVHVFRLGTARALNAGGGQPSECAPYVSISGLAVNSRGFAVWRQSSAVQQTTFTWIDGVSCPSVSLCVAVDTAGNVLSSTDPTGGRAAWSVAPHVTGGGAAPNSPGAVSCPTTVFCAAVSGSIVLTSTDPAGGASAWHAAIVDDKGLTSISCASESLCVAGDYAGDLLISTDPTGGASAWTKVAVDTALSPAAPAGEPTPGTFTSVSCPSTALCVATDTHGRVVTSTNPTGGAQAWSIAKVDTGPDPGLSVTCPSASLCIAPASADSTGGNVAISTNPAGGAGAWALTHIDTGREPIAAACATNLLCVVFEDRAGAVLTSTNPAGGPAAWTVSTAPILYPPVSSASCPSVSLCIAAGEDGTILSSTDPTGGGATWSAAPVEVLDCPLTTPCIAEQLYASAPDTAAQVLDSVPPGTGNVISDPSLNGNVVTWTDAGVARQVTLH